MSARILAWKTWCETRSRFAIGATAISAIAAFFVIVHPWVLQQWAIDHIRHPDWKEPQWLYRAEADYPFFLWHFLYADMLQKVCGVMAVLLGVGGLTREAAVGASTFTLGLPVTRRVLFATRSAVILVEVLALALIGGGSVIVASALTGQTYPLRHGIAHALLMGIGAVAFAALSVLLASVLEGEYNATLWGLAATGFVYFVLQPYVDGAPIPAVVRAFNISRVMAGSPDSLTFSWAGLIVTLTISAVALLAAQHHVERQDF